ncbi:hypothetical protein HYX14_03470 [Candidatus Woesearchaeota archaeon]|nr:hypothetical protein [Candidatus Woesearchaeota archaeon]
MTLPPSLRVWFVIHFVVDVLLAIPLLFFPALILGWFGFPAVETVTARVVGAALLAIGGTSLWMHQKGEESFAALLTLKIIWSSTAILGLLLSLWQGAPRATWLLAVSFAAFLVVWIYYLKRLRT